MKPHSRTWQGQASSETVTLQDLLDCCYANIREAARREAELVQLRNRLPAGDPRLRGTDGVPPLGYQILRARFDQAHWRGYQGYYLQRIALEGKDAVVRLPLPKKHLAWPPPAAPEEDPRLPRERQPGEDDGDELPF